MALQASNFGSSGFAAPSLLTFDYFPLPLEMTSHMRFLIHVVNTWHIFADMEVRKVSNSKVTFNVTQGHWKMGRSIGHIGLSVSLPLKLCLLVSILHHFRDILTHFPKFLTSFPQFKDVS